MLTKTYSRLLIKLFSLLSLRSLLVWGAVMGIYHGLYFILNLSERLPVPVERVFPYLYFLLFFLGLAFLIREAVRIIRHLPRYLEGNFDLGFRWYNALDQYKARVPESEVREILAGIGWGAVWEKLVPRPGLVWAGFLGWLVFPILFLILPSQHKRFTDNFRTIWNYQEPYLALEYPEQVLQNQDFSLTYIGEYTVAVFTKGGEEWHLESGESLTITNVLNPFNLEYRLKLGRIRKNGSVLVKVIPPPEIVSHVFTVKSRSRKTYNLEGVYNLIADYNSDIVLRLTYQPNQELTNFEVIAADKSSKEVFRPVVKQMSLFQLQIDFPLRENTDLAVRVQNRHGQWSEETQFTLSVRNNQSPTVVITEPEPFLRLDQPLPVRVGYAAKDDVSLREVILRYWINPGKGSRIDTTVKSFLGNPSGYSEENGGINLWVSNVILPLTSLNAPPGSRLTYYLWARDYEGGVGYSKTNEIQISTLGENYNESLQGGEYLKEGLDDRREDFNNLERDYEKLKILSETKKIDNQDIKNFQENVKEFSDKMKDDITKIENLEKDNFENKQTISENFRQKLLELKKSLEEMDKNFLQKMNERFQSMINVADQNLKPKEVEDFLQKMDLKQMEEKVEQTLLFLENLKKIQKIDALEKLSQNLYLRYKDLESYMVSDLLTPDQIQQEASGIKEGLELIKKEFEEIASSLSQDSRTEGIKKSIEDQLLQEKLSDFDRLVEQSQNDDFLAKRSDNLDQLRRNFARLNSQNQEHNQAELLATLNAQIFSINQKTEWLEYLDNSKNYDFAGLNDDKKLDLTTQYLSKYKTLLINYREKVFLLSSAATLELDFMEHYDRAIDKVGSIQRQISPDQQQPNNNNHPVLVKNLNTVKKTMLVLSRELILLKTLLKTLKNSQQNNMDINRAMEMQQNLNRRLQEMMQRGNLSEREKQYLKNMAMEQGLLRSLMEGADKMGNQSGNMPGGQPGQDSGNGSQGGKDGGGQEGSIPGRNGRGQEGGTSDGNAGDQKNGNLSGENGSQNGGKRGGEGGENQDDSQNQKRNEDDVSRQGKVSQKRREIADKMRQLERELLKNNPDFARIKELQKTIEENLFKETRGLQGKEKDDSQERTAERQTQVYQKSGPALNLPDDLIKTDRSALEKLKTKRISKTFPDFQDRIRRFIELNSIR